MRERDDGKRSDPLQQGSQEAKEGKAEGSGDGRDDARRVERGQEEVSAESARLWGRLRAALLFCGEQHTSRSSWPGLTRPPSRILLGNDRGTWQSKLGGRVFARP